MSTKDTTQALASSTTTIYMGTGLKLRVDQSSSLLEIIVDGGYVDVWGKSVQFAFDSQQLAVTLTFTPINGSGPVTASYVNSQGTTVVSTPQSGSALLTVQRPPSSGVSFDIHVDQDTQSFAAAIAAPTPTDDTPTPSARLQTKLVLTTVDPPPDPDLLPKPESA